MQIIEFPEGLRDLFCERTVQQKPCSFCLPHLLPPANGCHFQDNMQFSAFLQDPPYNTVLLNEILKIRPFIRPRVCLIKQEYLYIRFP